jgi:hypothetical protein
MDRQVRGDIPRQWFRIGQLRADDSALSKPTSAVGSSLKQSYRECSATAAAEMPVVASGVESCAMRSFLEWELEVFSARSERYRVLRSA